MNLAIYPLSGWIIIKFRYDLCVFDQELINFYAGFIRFCPPVGECSDFILEHLLVDAEVGVGVEVVVLARHLGRGQLRDVSLLRNNTV